MAWLSAVGCFHRKCTDAAFHPGSFLPPQEELAEDSSTLPPPTSVHTDVDMDSVEGAGTPPPTCKRGRSVGAAVSATALATAGLPCIPSGVASAVVQEQLDIKLFVQQQR